MAQDLRSLNVYPAFKTFEIGDSACTEILLPSAANQVSVGCDGTKIYIAQNGYTEGNDIDTNNNAFIPSNRASSLFVQSSSGNVKCHVILEEA
jgi:hypothetical protein